MRTVDLKLGPQFDREGAEQLLMWYPDGLPSDVADVVSLCTGIDRDELAEVLERVERNRNRRLSK